MPIARFQMPDGRVARFEVPEGTTPEQAQAMISEQVNQQTEQPAQQEKAAPRTWSDVPGEALGNFPKSAGNFVGGIYQAVRHPVETGSNLLKLGQGIVVKAAPDAYIDWLNKVNPGNAGKRGEVANVANAVGQFYKDRYGGIENIKNTLATDPVGSAADLSAVLTLGAGATSRVPAVSSALRKTSNAINPVNLAAKGVAAGAKGLGKLSSEIIGGVGTHTGGESLMQAGKAGFAGGDRAKVLTQNMRGQVPMSDVLETAKANLDDMARAKSAQYRQGMAQVSGDKTVLNFNGIDKALSDANKTVRFGSQVKNQKAAEVLQGISDEIANWRKLDPAQYHTPEGLDALKQKIGGLVDSIPYEEKTARMVGNKIYHSIKGEITNQAPTYAKVMKDYSEATDLIREIERTLVGTDKTSIDTALRKLQSLMRNNVNSNYGNRANLAKELVDRGGRDIMPALAGQALSAKMPRGLGGAVAGGLGLGGLAYGGVPGAVGALAVQSPRLMGEAALKSGQFAKMLANSYNAPVNLTNGLLNTPELANLLYQTGRLPNQ